MKLSDIRRSLVVGAGAMGHGIAQVYAIAGYEVDLVDAQATALDLARERIRTSLARLAEFGTIRREDGPAILARIRLTTDLASVAPHADVVTEAIVEDRDAKQELFTNLDRWLRPDALVASNTSGLDVFALLRDAMPGRLPHIIIHHYFLPAVIIPLVEVVAGPQTSRESLDLVTSLSCSTGSTRTSSSTASRSPSPPWRPGCWPKAWRAPRRSTRR
jgi:3-hydroxyacyl-CoA dehydrogenase